MQRKRRYFYIYYGVILIRFSLGLNIQKFLNFQPMLLLPQIQIFVQRSGFVDRVRTNRISQQGQVLQEELVRLKTIQKELQVLQLILVQTENCKLLNPFKRKLAICVCLTNHSNKRFLSSPKVRQLQFNSLSADEMLANLSNYKTHARSCKIKFAILELTFASPLATSHPYLSNPLLCVIFSLFNKVWTITALVCRKQSCLHVRFQSTFLR